MKKKSYLAWSIIAALLVTGCGAKGGADTSSEIASATENVTETATQTATQTVSDASDENVSEADSEGTGKDKSGQKSESDAESAGKSGDSVKTGAQESADYEVMSYVTDEYKLVWADEFNSYEGELSKDDWNYEAHQVGWVNSELQKYVASSDYAFVKDGELIIQPVKNDDGSYVSGRVNTSGKHDFTYGIFEARLKVPEGKGFLPAFWMMPTDENLYGQWPKCGEIDIMEVLGDSTNRQYGTLHFGEPHTQKQGTYELHDGGDFSKEYHVFAVEWEPGMFRWYVDGNLFYENNDWFTKRDGEEEKPYPAPFNQPFHMILNVAVGGSWPGYPDETTIFDERAAMYVDYVHVYQKDSYDENVEKPVKVFNDREPDETGNYVNNSSFSEEEDLTDNVDWKFLLLNGGEGNAEIKDDEIVISSTNAGSEEYSVQLVQPDMPLHKGEKYRLSFDAYADEDRTMITAVTAPEVDWIRYFPDTKVELTGEWQTYSFEFDMEEADDDKGRVEFNMGKQDSTATIHITNVRLEKVQ